jgi:hypothetical protein
VQNPLAANENNPGAQESQTVAPYTFEAVPATQEVHVELPLKLENLPGEHWLHAEAAAIENAPEGQTVQVVAAEPEN